MIKVNIQTLVATRDPVPANLTGLDAYTLQNLQTELNPVPANLIDLEWWPEDTFATSYDPETQRLGDEILTADNINKVVDVTHVVVNLTAKEISDNLDNAKAVKITDLDSLFITKRDGGTVVNGDNVGTDHESISSITSSASLMGRVPVETIRYKLDGVWTTLNKAAIEALQDSIWSHIKSVSQVASDHDAAINALVTVRAILDYDITAGW